MPAMLSMQKIAIADLEAAYDAVGLRHWRARVSRKKRPESVARSGSLWLGALS
jgi:hypothetical protein